MKIYKSEIEAGLSEKVLAKNTIALVSTAVPYTPDQPDIEKASVIFNDSTVAENKDQMDLYYLKSVLVSTGWNKNDDVFSNDELWVARKTPEDKQFNYMHNEEDIIGHITSNEVVDFSGNAILEDLEKAPEQFEIVTGAVIYKSWSSLERRERVNDLIQEIEEGKWFVSMECLFNNFDYAVIAPDGGNKVVARNEGSAFLTKHLRSYGGNGEYEGHKLGRLLRNISFSGKGLVNKPANPRSIILKDRLSFSDSKAFEIEEVFINSVKENSNMADEHAVLQNQIAELKQNLAEANDKNAELVSQLSEMDEKAVSEKLEELQAQVQKRDETIASLEAVAETHDSEKQELIEKNQAAAEQVETIQAKLDEIEAEAHKNQRLVALKDAGLTEEEAEAKLEAFSEASDELFAEVVTLLADRNPVAADEEVEAEAEETDEEETDEAEADSRLGYPGGAGPKKKFKKGGKVKKEDPAEDKDDAESSADTEALEEVEEEVEAALADAGETDEVQSARAGASEWLRDHVLKSTAGLTEK